MWDRTSLFHREETVIERGVKTNYFFCCQLDASQHWSAYTWRLSWQPHSLSLYLYLCDDRNSPFFFLCGSLVLACLLSFSVRFHFSEPTRSRPVTFSESLDLPFLSTDPKCLRSTMSAFSGNVKVNKHLGEVGFS